MAPGRCLLPKRHRWAVWAAALPGLKPMVRALAVRHQEINPALGKAGEISAHANLNEGAE